MLKQGIILKGIGGFYYVETADAVYECKAKGKFRKQGISPMAGDNVTICVAQNSENTIEEILPRKNYLVRPPVANIDFLAIVSSVAHPQPSTLIIDKLTAMAEKRGIEPVIIFTKADLGDTRELAQIYRLAGFNTFTFSKQEKSDEAKLLSLLSGKVTALCGNTGVGKSTLLNMLKPDLELATGEISMKLGRGRHTTREAQLLRVGDCLIADTAGFSTVNILEGETFLAEDLPFYFRDFEQYMGKCRFTTCAHVNDSGCAVRQAVESGEVGKTRHESYVAMYNEIKDLKKWQL